MESVLCVCCGGPVPGGSVCPTDGTVAPGVAKPQGEAWVTSAEKLESAPEPLIQGQELGSDEAFVATPKRRSKK